MIRIFLLTLFLVPYNVFSQNIKCPNGYSYMPTIATSSLRIEADECLPDSVVKRLWLTFNKNMCKSESGLFIPLSKDTIYLSFGTWNKDHCIYTQRWYVKDKLVKEVVR